MREKSKAKVCEKIFLLWSIKKENTVIEQKGQLSCLVEREDKFQRWLMSACLQLVI